MTEEKEKKKWPKEYYGTRYDCSLEHLKHATPSRARKAGILGWRSWDSKANVLDTVKPQA